MLSSHYIPIDIVCTTSAVLIVFSLLTPNLAKPEPKTQTQSREKAKSQSLLFFSLCDRTAPILSWSSRPSLFVYLFFLCVLMTIANLR